MDGAFKPAAQVAADENTARFRNNVHKAFKHLDHKMTEVISLNLKTYDRIMNIHSAIDLENSPARHPPSPRSFSPLNNLPLHQPSSPLSTLSAASVPPSPKIPNVNLIEPTPDNSQKEEQTSTQLLPTPPSPNPILEPSVEVAAAAVPTSNSEEKPAADALPVTEPPPSPTNEVQAAALPSTNFHSPQPTCPSPRRTRSRTLVPALEVPEVSPRRTRSVTRARSPTPRPRSKGNPTSDIEDRKA